MANTGDFFRVLDNGESTMPLAYLLLMANILGLAVYLDSKKKTKTCIKEAENKLEKETPTPISEIHTNEKTISNIKKSTSLEEIQDTFSNVTLDRVTNLESTIDEKKSLKGSLEVISNRLLSEKPEKEEPKARDKIIDFKDAVASKGKEAKRTLEPLVWRFPAK